MPPPRFVSSTSRSAFRSVVVFSTNGAGVGVASLGGVVALVGRDSVEPGAGLGDEVATVAPGSTESRPSPVAGLGEAEILVGTGAGCFAM